MIALYADPQVIELVVQDLTAAGVSRDAIHVVSEGAQDRYHELCTWTDRRRERDLGKGAWAGLIVGTLLGVLLSLGLGLVPVGLADDPTAAGLAAAGLGAGGGLAAGVLVALMIPRKPLVQPRPLGAGAAMIAVVAQAQHAHRVRLVLNRHDPLDLDPAARPLPTHGPVGRADDLDWRKDTDLLDSLGWREPL